MERPHKHYRKQILKKHWVNIWSKKCVKQRQSDETILLVCSLLFNYDNMAWGSTHKTKWHNIHLKQKHAIRLTSNENKFTHNKPLMPTLQVLNVFQINIQKSL